MNFSNGTRGGYWLAVVLSGLALVLSGCRPAGSATSETAAKATNPAAAKQQAPDAEATEFWDVLYMQNSKIGYSQTTIRPIERDGKKLVETDSLNELTLVRFGQKTEQKLKTQTIENARGELLEFTTEVNFGPTPTVSSGHAEGQKMVIETRVQQARQTASIPWSKDIGGFRAAEESLERNPPKPGERRTLKMLVPIVNQVADVELVARDYETTQVLGAELKLLRVDGITRLPDGNELASTVWIDSRGVAIKTRMDAMRQEAFRASRELALGDAPSGASFDLGSDVLVKPDKPIERPHETTQIRYEVTLASSNPIKVFASGDTQAVRPIDEHRAEITVRSIRPDELPNGGKNTKMVDAPYLAANGMLQSDSPRIVEMSKKARGAAHTPAEIAIALESYVHRIVANKNFTQAFATAAEVAETREGDCTEHAVLLAALARACQIPSRVAIGLVYVQHSGGFGYHMWTEMHLGDRWVPMDATLGRGGIGAAHLKLTDSSLEGATAYSSFLLVAQVIGQLQIRVLDVQPAR